MSAAAVNALGLTDEEYWDAYWNALKLPVEIRRHPRSLYLNAILDCVDRHLPDRPGLSVLEIGGAPGQYLAYLHRRFGYSCCCLDYSPLGCEKTRENFSLLGIPGTVHEQDLFDDRLDVPRHDVVYSLGLVEHFSDLEDVVSRHLRFVKPGGTLMLGAPNLLGINRWFLQRLAPEVLDVVDLRAMDLDNWRRFESALQLEPLFRGYVGGLEPCVFRARLADRQRRPLAKAVSIVDLVVHGRLRALRRLNSRLISGYILGIYRAPHTPVIGGQHPRGLTS